MRRVRPIKGCPPCHQRYIRSRGVRRVISDTSGKRLIAENTALNEAWALDIDPYEADRSANAEVEQIVQWFATDNPTGEALARKIKLPLYYTGLTKTANIQIGEEAAKDLELARDFSAAIEVVIPARGYLHIVIK